MSTIVLAALAAGTALGLLLILAGLTGRQLFDAPSGYLHRARSSSLLPKVAIAAVAALLAITATGWLVGGILAAIAVLVIASPAAILAAAPAARAFAERHLVLRRAPRHGEGASLW